MEGGRGVERKGRRRVVGRRGRGRGNTQPALKPTVDHPNSCIKAVKYWRMANNYHAMIIRLTCTSVNFRRAIGMHAFRK